MKVLGDDAGDHQWGHYTSHMEWESAIWNLGIEIQALRGE